MVVRVIDFNRLPRDAKVTVSQVAARYSKCSKTIIRWSDNPDVGLPKAKIIRGHHWNVGEILDFDAKNPSISGEAENNVLAGLKAD